MKFTMIFCVLLAGMASCPAANIVLNLGVAAEESHMSLFFFLNNNEDGDVLIDELLINGNRILIRGIDQEVWHMIGVNKDGLEPTLIPAGGQSLWEMPLATLAQRMRPNVIESLSNSKIMEMRWVVNGIESNSLFIRFDKSIKDIYSQGDDITIEAERATTADSISKRINLRHDPCGGRGGRR